MAMSRSKLLENLKYLGHVPNCFAGMASRMVELVKNRGRAYRCVPCGYIESKHRAEVHYYKKHVAEFEVPFMCVACDFRGGDATKFQRHQESPGHLEKTDPLTSEIAIQHSQSPRFMMMMSWSLTTHQPFWVISVSKVYSLR